MDGDLEVVHHHNRDHSDHEPELGNSPGHDRRSREEINELKQQDDIAVSKKDGPLADAMNKLSVDDVSAK